MLNLAALMRALPRSALQPAVLATLDGFVDGPERHHWWNRVELLEPPAGLCEPCIEPLHALTLLLRHQGMAAPQAQDRAREAVARLQSDVAPDRWVRYFDHDDANPPACLPVSDFVDWLRTASLGVPAHVLDFVERASSVAANAPLFQPDHEGRMSPMNRVALHDLPARPYPKDLFSFFHAPWCDGEHERPGWDAEFLSWRESMRPVAQALEQALGQQLYQFDDHAVVEGDVEDDGQIDFAHRFFVLHWCCTHRPDSGFVRHLLRASGAAHLDELKAALIAPASYTHPFALDALHVSQRSTHACNLHYLPPDARHTLVVVFSTVEARDVAQVILPPHIGVDVRLVAPAELAADAWMRRAAPDCRSWQCWPQQDGWLDRPIELLTAADEVCVIADDDRFSWHLNLSDAAENLLWLAIDQQLKYSYRSTDGWGLSNPDQSLKKRGVPARVAARQAERAAFTRQLSEIRLAVGFGGSGLQDARGRRLSHDQLDLPLALLRRVAAWQSDLREAAAPTCEHRDRWQQALEQEQIDIARALRAARAWKVMFKPPRRQVWLDVDEIDRPAGTGAERY